MHSKYHSLSIVAFKLYYDRGIDKASEEPTPSGKPEQASFFSLTGKELKEARGEDGKVYYNKKWHA